MPQGFDIARTAGDERSVDNAHAKGRPRARYHPEPSPSHNDVK